MPVAIGPAGPGTPIITDAGDMSIDIALQDPLTLHKVIESFPAGYFIADTLFGTDVSPSGAVIYNQLSALDLYVDADAGFQPQNVNPGDEFPAVGLTDTFDKVALTTKNGGFFAITDEERRRNRRDVMAQKLQRLKNTLVQISNAKVINALLNDAVVLANATTATGGIWSTTSNNPLNDITRAIAAVDYGAGELGYTTDTALLHPDAYAYLQGWLAANPGSLPRESRSDNPLFNKEINGLKGLNWIISRRVPRTTLIVAQAKICGTLVSEIPPFTEVVPERTRQRTVVISGRQEVPVVTAPYAVHVKTGIIS